MSAGGPAGYSGTPVARKLGLAAGMRVTVLACPSAYGDLVGPLPEGVVIDDDPGGRTDLAHVFATSAPALAVHLADLRATLRPAVPTWVSWPKKASKVPTDVTEDVIRAIALPMGWVDVKVCAIDATWSGLKLVVRVSQR